MASDSLCACVCQQSQDLKFDSHSFLHLTSIGISVPGHVVVKIGGEPTNNFLTEMISVTLCVCR